MTTTIAATERLLTALHKAVYLVDRSAERILKDHNGGTFTQFLVLMSIGKCPGLSQQKIADFLDLTPAAVSRQIDALVAQGHIDRAVDTKNRRSHIVTLTKSGETRLESMKDALLSSFSTQTQLTTEEIDSAVVVLEKMMKSMGAPDTCN